jgi:two-component system response regulator HydG
MFKQSNDRDGELAAVTRGMSTGQDEKPKEQNVIKPESHILLIDDQVLAREQLKRFYTANGYAVHTVGTGEDGLNYANRHRVDLIVVGRRLWDNLGAEFIARLQQHYPGVSIILTGYSSMDHSYISDRQVIGCDYIADPFDTKAVQQVTRAALNKTYVFSQSMSFRRSLDDTDGEFGMFLSKTAGMHQLFESIQLVAPTNMTVLLEGEAGTGKELVANAIHYKSFRRNRPFVSVNCAGFPNSLLETELFGCREGDVLGADLKGTGKIKLADGGTLFLDEIECMAPFVQSKFMRVIEDCTSVHLGAQQRLDSDVRVIAASNVPVQDLVGQGKMRTDLYYRINVVPIRVLSLRDRSNDIPLLIDDFLRRHQLAAQKGIVGMAHDPLRRMIEYPWPGNIRELQNVLEKAIVLTKGSVIENIDLPVTKEPVDADASTFV